MEQNRCLRFIKLIRLLSETIFDEKDEPIQRTSLNKSYIRTVSHLPTIALFTGRRGVNNSVEKRPVLDLTSVKKPNEVRTYEKTPIL